MGLLIAMSGNGSFTVGDWLVEPDLNRVSRGSESTSLRHQVMELLVYLARHQGSVVSTDDLMNDLWAGRVVTDGTLYSCVAELRNALGHDQADYIETIPKKGYRLLAPVSGLDDGPSQTEDTQKPTFPLAAIAAAVFIAVLAVIVGLNIAALRDRFLDGITGDPITSLAVLPLDNFSGDPEQQYFTDGMTEALTSELGRMKSLKVISRTSAMQYKNTDKLLPEIASELQVDALLEGSVLRAGDEVRITLQLIDGTTDRHLWSGNYERDLRDILTLQSEVARAIANEVEVTLIPFSGDELPNSEGTAVIKALNPKAYEAYLKGRYHFNSFGLEAFQTAVHYYEEAVAIDSTFAPAYAALAEACLQPLILFNDIRSFDQCEAAALRAVELDDQLAEAHAALGLLYLMQWNWAASETEFLRAIDLNPNSVMARQWYAEVLRITRRPEGSLEQIRRAEELDPLNLFIKTMVGWPLKGQGRYEEALAQWDEVLQMNPDFGAALFSQGLVYVAMGDSELVFASAEKLAKVFGENSMEARLLTAAGYALRREEVEALEILTGVKRDWGRYAYGWSVVIHVLLGQEEEALNELEKGYELRTPELPVSISLPWVDSLRDHPRFQAVSRKMGVP